MKRKTIIGLVFFSSMFSACDIIFGGPEDDFGSVPPPLEFGDSSSDNEGDGSGDSSILDQDLNTITGFAWVDSNKDGIYQKGEEDLMPQGSEVRIYVSNGPSDGLATTALKEDGSFIFELTPEQIETIGENKIYLAFAPLEGWTFTIKGEGFDEGFDSDVFPETGFTPTFRLGDFDFFAAGYVSRSTFISGFAWEDSNNDGIYQPDDEEVMPEGLEVSLFLTTSSIEGGLANVTHILQDGTFTFELKPDQVEAIGDDEVYVSFSSQEGFSFTEMGGDLQEDFDSDVFQESGFTQTFRLGDFDYFGAGYVRLGKSGTKSEHGYTITWWVRQEGDHVVVIYSAIYDRNGTTPSGTPFATTAVGNPGLDPLGGHASGEFSDGEAHVRTPIMHPAGTEIDIWISFQGLDEAIKLTTIEVSP